MRDFLFVMGLGRSGTSPLTRLLNGHRDIALGMERYKGLWQRIDELTPSRFEHQSFFDFSDGLTNLTPAKDAWARHYRALDAKFLQARYVGDKLGRSFAAAHRRYRQALASKPRELPEDVRAYVEENADLRRWGRVTSLAM